MNWKKWSCCLLILGCLLVWGSRAPLWAGEMDAMHLLNLLKKKGVITQEEANELMNEVRSEAKKEKVEITTAVKEDIKKDAGKDLPLPKGLKGFSFSSTIFGEYTAKSIKNGASSNDFNVNRAYITLKKEFTPLVGYENHYRSFQFQGCR